MGLNAGREGLEVDLEIGHSPDLFTEPLWTSLRAVMLRNHYVTEFNGTQSLSFPPPCLPPTHVFLHSSMYVYCKECFESFHSIPMLF